MKFSETIQPQQIILELKALDRWSAIEELVDQLLKSDDSLMGKRDQILQSIRSREEAMSTGMGFGVAIPHASLDHVTHISTVMARSPSGVDYDSIDNQPVKLMVLLLTPAGQNQENLRTLANIARFLNNREFRQKAETAVSAEEIYQLILSHEG